MTGSRILEIRKKLGLTQAELARALEISSVTVNRWENNDPRYKPSDKDVRLLEALVEIMDKTSKDSEESIRELRDALRVSTVGGIVGAAALRQLLSTAAICALAATPGLGWIGTIAGIGIGASLPFIGNLFSKNQKEKPERKTRK